MLRYILYDLEDNYAFERVTNDFGYCKTGDVVIDATDGHKCKVLLCEGGAFNGKKKRG